MANHPDHPRLAIIDPLVAALETTAEAAGRAARKRVTDKRRKSGYEALRPGVDTPLWNELAETCSRYLNRRGEKVRLARVLGVSRQRLHLLLVSRSACPDAERTLQLLMWLRARKAGRDVA